jgi:drug/metabolite transporter (DMT)-like permease
MSPRTLSRTFRTALHRLGRRIAHAVGPKGLAAGALVAAALLWGTSFLLGKVALRDLAPPELVLFRFALALALLGPIAWRQAASIPRSDLLRFAVAGILMVPCSFLLQFEGLARTTAARASLIMGAAPAVMALGAALFRRERLSLLGWGAAALSTFGVALMVGGPHEAGSFLGDGLVLASLITLAGWTAFTKDLLERHSPLVVTATCMAFGTAVLLPVVALQGHLAPASLAAMASVGPGTWGAVVALGVGCTAVTYVLWNWGLQRVEMSTSGILVNLEPLTGSILGVALLGDPVNTGLAVGGLCILGATAALPNK